MPKPATRPVVAAWWIIAATMKVAGAVLLASMFLPDQTGTLCGGPPGLPEACLPYRHVAPVALGLRVAGLLVASGALAAVAFLWRDGELVPALVEAGTRVEKT